MKVLPILFMALAVFVSGCTQNTGVNSEQVRAQTACVLFCKLSAEQGNDLSKGPCLKDDLQPDWVCDVVHSPRIDVDDLPENQCPSFGKTANHFVEVDEYCDVVQIY